MEVDDIQCKYPRISNGNGRIAMDDQYPDEEDEGDNKRINAAGRFYGWPSSRIVRVSRASGGKDRHSKVLTSKGLRDRRVRLSVNTAIQFYDLQDRLGYDQPSKAVEWLLKAAATSIAELPPMNSPFPDTPKQVSDDKRSSTGGSDQLGFDSAELDLGDPKQVTKSSACSSNSENSKGSGLSLSRSESRIKARERAKGRVAEKEKEKDLNPISQTTSFTELLNGGGGGGTNNVNTTTATNESNLFLKSPRQQWSTMDYFTSGLLAPSSGRSGQMGNPFTTSPLFSVTAENHHHHHPELQHFSFVPDHLVPVVNNNNSSEYNLNFTISPCANSSGLVGFNRGTLQSNSSSPSLMPHLQRFSDGPSPSFFIGTTAAPVENQHQFLSGYDSRLQLCYGDPHANSGRHSAHKGKGKN